MGEHWQRPSKSQEFAERQAFLWKAARTVVHREALYRAVSTDDPRHHDYYNAQTGRRYPDSESFLLELALLAMAPHGYTNEGQILLGFRTLPLPQQKVLLMQYVVYAIEKYSVFQDQDRSQYPVPKTIIHNQLRAAQRQELANQAQAYEDFVVWQQSPARVLAEIERIREQAITELDHIGETFDS